MKNKIVLILLSIVFLAAIHGCAIKSLSQESWCKFLNVSKKESYSEVNYSNLLWSKDNKKIYFITNDYRGHYYRVVRYIEGFQPIPPFLSFLFGGGHIDQLPYADNQIISTLYEVAIDDAQHKIKSLHTWQRKTDVGLGYSELDYCEITWLNEQEICDTKGNVININTLELKHSLWDSESNCCMEVPNSEYLLVTKIVDKRFKVVKKLWQPSRLSVYGYRANWIKSAGGDIAIYDRDNKELIQIKKSDLLPSDCDFNFPFLNEVYPSSDAQKLAFNIRCEKKGHYIGVINIDGADFKLFSYTP